LVLDPLELIEKLSVLVPAPRFHLLRFHGLLAPHAADRAQVVPHPRQAAGAGGGAPAAAAGPSWATLLKRLFALDVLLCPRCGGRRQIVGLYPGGPRRRDLRQRLGLGDHASRPPPTPAG
jgi:hypothetical protein